MLMAQLMQLEDLELNLAPKISDIMNKIHNTPIITIINGSYFTKK